MRMRSVYERMTRDPITVSADTAVSDACCLMVDHEIRRLPVVEDGKLVGILTWTDVRGALPEDACSSDIFTRDDIGATTRVDEIMTRNPVTLTPLATIDQAVHKMLDHKIGSLPIVLEDEVLGIITETDLLRLMVTDTVSWSMGV